MSNYSHFDARMRDLIAKKFTFEGKKYAKIAEELGVATSSVWEEIHRNMTIANDRVIRTGKLKGRKVRLVKKYFLYDAAAAQIKAVKRIAKVRCPERIVKGSDLFHAIEGMLCDDGFKPDVIAGRLAVLFPNDATYHVSHETIYKYIYKHPENGWYEYLRKARVKRKKQSNRKSNIPNRVSIHKRPSSVEDRVETGHWEGIQLLGV